MKKFRKGIFVVVYRKEKNKILYLILKRKLHWAGWEFPKGGVELFEFSRSVVKRELFEETGKTALKIKRHKSSGNYDYDREYQDRPGMIGQTYKLYSAEVLGKDVKLDKKEHSDYKWLEFEKAFSLLTWPNQKICLKLVNDYLGK
jgi:8-oxo-dGTP pyrophosphatase MutT (NUDIX family)